MKDPAKMSTKELIEEKEKSAPQNKKRKSRYIPKVKICAACGSFAHGNPGHDI